MINFLIVLGFNMYWFIKEGRNYFNLYNPGKIGGVSLLFYAYLIWGLVALIYDI